MAENDEPRKKRRPWRLTISLRTLLELIAVVAVALAFWKMQPARIEPGSVLRIDVEGTLGDMPITGLYTVAPNGTVDLGYQYGAVPVRGLSTSEAHYAIRAQLQTILGAPEVYFYVVGDGDVQTHDTAYEKTLLLKNSALRMQNEALYEQLETALRSKPMT